MTDELTPQEKEALKNLPRERMPLGLEARVVDAMRDKGFLEKPKRAIEITNSRVAGLLAACVALMIGAYSIGLHRGGGDQVLPSVATMERDARGPVEVPFTDALDAPEKKTSDIPSGDVSEAEQPASDKGTEKMATPERREKAQIEVTEFDNFDDADVIEQPAADTDRSDIPQAKIENVAKPASPPARSVEKAKEDPVRPEEAKEEGLAVVEPKPALQPEQETPAVRDALKGSALRTQGQFLSADAPAPKRPLTFLLNGSPVVVEAPDSVRVIQDDSGRVLIIYTSDGIIRIRLGDND